MSILTAGGPEWDIGATVSKIGLSIYNPCNDAVRSSVSCGLTIRDGKLDSHLECHRLTIYRKEK